MSLREADVLVVGAGVVGLTIALAWKDRHPADRVQVIDKEDRLGAHASGRNSGVLHAGLYYPPGTLKARFARDGNREWVAWCTDRGLPLRSCGKLVVARSRADHGPMDELLRRAADNQVPLQAIDAAEAARIEPRARTVERALFAPETASVDPLAILGSLEAHCAEVGVGLHRGVAWVSRSEQVVHTSAGPVAAGLLVNAAGLHADRIAAAYGFGLRYRILPFRGFTLQGDSDLPPLACHVYPVPDLELPFLGVHFTARVDGSTTIGPTATPALWREQYGGLSGLALRDVVEVGTLGARKLFSDRAFRALARREIGLASRGALLQAARELVPGLDPTRWTRWRPPGIRAQLVDRSTAELVMDFRVEGDRRSFHVLNAISPGFTCSLPFARWCCDAMERNRG